MVEAASEEGFRVTDRRRRPDDEPASRTTQPAPTAESRAAAPPSAATAPSSDSVGVAHSAPTPSREAPKAAPSAASRSAERSLADLFMTLASEAVIALGDAPDPMTGERHRELPEATGVIDLLLLLREKTEGNRSLEETQLLDEVIYDLQMRYVRASRKSG